MEASLVNVLVHTDCLLYFMVYSVEIACGSLWGWILTESHLGSQFAYLGFATLLRYKFHIDSPQSNKSLLKLKERLSRKSQGEIAIIIPVQV